MLCVQCSVHQLFFYKHINLNQVLKIKLQRTTPGMHTDRQ